MVVEGGSVEPRVTGSDSGIGQTTATLLATEGFDVGLTRHEDTAGVQGTVRVAVLQAVFDRVDSWEDGADAATVREELDKAIEKSDIEVDDALRERIVRHIVEDTSHGDVRQLLD